VDCGIASQGFRLESKKIGRCLCKTRYDGRICWLSVSRHNAGNMLSVFSVI
jgi:hypothetical protein